MLDLVGEQGDQSYSRHVLSLIARHRLEARVRVRGALGGTDLVERYDQADVFVLPSRPEGFGTVYAEATSFGLPVIGCRVDPLPWLIEGGCGMLVKPGDVAALAMAMGTLATDASLRQRMGEAARRRARGLPTWQENGDRFVLLVRGLLERHRRTRMG